MQFRRMYSLHLNNDEVDASVIRYEFGFGFYDLYLPYLEAILLHDVRHAKKLWYDFYLAHKT